MGRGLVFDESVENYIKELFSYGIQFQIGLLIGQTLSNRDLVFTFIPTPFQEENQESTTKAQSFETIDDLWISEHARQVLRMLPGGIDIIGIFSLAPTETVKSRTGLLQQILNSIYSVQKLQTTNLATTERLLFHICSQTRKYSCKTLDVSNKQNSFRPAEFKFQPFLSNFKCFTSIYKLDVDVFFENSGVTFKQSILEPVLKEIEDSFAVIDNRIIPNDDSTPIEKAVLKRKNPDCNVDLLVAPRESHTSQSTIVGCAKVSGHINCRAYVFSKEEISFAIKSLKKDLVNSITTRLELLSEELVQQKSDKISDGINDTVWVLPRRVFIPLLPEILASDYLFPTETLENCKERCNLMLSIHSKSDRDDFTAIEEFPPDDVSMLDQVQVSIVDQQLPSTELPQHKTSVQPKVTLAQTPNKSNNFLILAFISLLIALLVTVLFYQ